MLYLSLAQTLIFICCVQLFLLPDPNLGVALIERCPFWCWCWVLLLDHPSHLLQCHCYQWHKNQHMVDFCVTWNCRLLTLDCTGVRLHNFNTTCGTKEGAGHASDDHVAVNRHCVTSVIYCLMQFVELPCSVENVSTARPQVVVHATWLLYWDQQVIQRTVLSVTAGMVLRCGMLPLSCADGPSWEEDPKICRKLWCKS